MEFNLHPPYPDFYVTSADAINTSLSDDPTINLLGTYGAGDAGAEVICCCKTMYAPDPYVGLLLGNNLTPVEAWNCLQGVIVNSTAEAS